MDASFDDMLENSTTLADLQMIGPVTLNGRPDGFSINRFYPDRNPVYGV